jgi:aspartate aminotransferase
LECLGESTTRFGVEPNVVDIFGSFTGLTAPQTKALAERAHIYMTADGRISMAGLNGRNIDYFAESVSSAVKGTL